MNKLINKSECPYKGNLLQCIFYGDNSGLSRTSRGVEKTIHINDSSKWIRSWDMTYDANLIF